MSGSRGGGGFAWVDIGGRGGHYQWSQGDCPGGPLPSSSLDMAPGRHLSLKLSDTKV